jgi:hypothetical protein
MRAAPGLTAASLRSVGLASRGWATLQPDAHGVVHIGDDFMLARTPALCLILLLY